MARALKTVGMVVAAVALVATGVGLAIGTGAVIAGGVTVGTVATVAGLASGVIGLASALLYKPPSFGGGNPQQFQTNPQSGLPYCIGRTAMSGVRIHADTTNSPGWDKDDILGFGVLLHAGGEAHQIEQFTADNQAVSFDASGQATTAPFSDSRGKWMAQKLWLGGAMASALALSLNGAAMPAWGSTHKLSGMAHGLWMMRFDTKGHHFDAGVPQPRWVGKWAKVYDPRLDSTYPGGSGSCRALNESTYVWSRSPALHALTWCIGRWQNGKRVLGIGAPLAMIRMADFVEAANVAEANGWHAGGVAWTSDSKWNVLKGMLQAGGAVPTMNGAMIGCRVFAPRVAIAIIESRHLLDGLQFSATKSRRDRINSIIPRYRSEDHDWEVVSGSAVTVAAWVSADGGLRQRELDLPFVQNEVGQSGVDSPAQIGALCRYEIENAREAGPISFTTGPEFIGLKSGDCIILNVPEEGFANTKCILLRDPAFDPATGKISFAAETETDEKHDFALGTVSDPPPAFALTPPDLLPAQPASGLWSLAADIGADGLPLLRITGGARTVSWQGLVVQYRKTGAASWIMAGAFGDDGTLVVEIPGVDGSTEYEAQVAYYSGVGTGAFRTLAPATTGANGLATAVADAVALLDTKTTTFVQDTAPTAAESSENDLWIDTANGNRLYRRVAGTGRLSIGGSAITLGGDYVTLPWVAADDQRVAQALLDAAGAEALADRKVESFILYSASDALPASAAVGDLLYRTYLSPVQVDRWSGSAWVPLATYGATSGQIGDIATAGTTATWPGVTGTGKPADNATVGAPVGTNVGSTPAATVESGANAANAGVNADGTIKDDKVDTPAVITDAIVGPPAGIETSGTFNHTGWSTRGSISYAPYSANSNLLIFIAGVVTIGDASAAGTYAEVRLLKAGLQIFGPVTISRTRGGEQVFSFPVSESGWSGAETLELQYRASATHGGGDPHLVDSSTIRILEGKNA